MEKIPLIGLGTYRLRKDVVISSVTNGLNIGYRHIDTANLYSNEMEIGQVIKNCGIKRNEFWITTKVGLSDIKNGPQTIYASIVNSLKQLNTEYLDLVLLHGPVDGKLMESWAALEEIILGNVINLKDKVRYIGVSNYDIEHLNVMLPTCRIKPYANQFEISPYLNRSELVTFCRENGIIIVAHSSLIKGEKFDDVGLEDISKRIKISKPLILLAWALHHNMIVLPRSSSREHIEENIMCLDIKLGDDVVKELDMFYKISTYCTHPQYIKK